jgi:hypothetical protein
MSAAKIGSCVRFENHYYGENITNSQPWANSRILNWPQPISWAFPLLLHSIIGYQTMSDLREIDSISDLRSLTGGVNQTSVHVRTPSEEAGVFLPKNKDPFGLGDDGVIALQADQST